MHTERDLTVYLIPLIAIYHADLPVSSYVKPFDAVLALSELAKPQMNIAMQVLMIRYTHDLNADSIYYA